MLSINHNYTKLPGQYLFSEISRRLKQYESSKPNQSLIRLGIGDVTRPLPPVVVSALHQAVDEQTQSSTFRGYGPEQGYVFLRDAIADDYQDKYQVSISADEIFISDGSKCDTGNFGELFSQSAKVAVCDPVYPVYVDSNAMAGRAGDFDADAGRWSNLIYLPCLEDNGFIPQLPPEDAQAPDLIYLCFPNNPTGAVASRDALTQWVRYAIRNQSLILYDAAYAAFIRDDFPRSIYEIEGADTCAVEFCSFSKMAGFTGLRLGFTVVPKKIKVQDYDLHALWQRRQTTKFNGASYLAQAAGAAVYTGQGQREISESVRYYQENADLLLTALESVGFHVFGGRNAPYLWLKTPDAMKSWDFFDYLLNKAGIAGTPGSGFGPCGEGYFRLTAFGTQEQTQEAADRITNLFSR